MVFGDKVSRIEYDKLCREKAQLQSDLLICQNENQRLKLEAKKAQDIAIEVNRQKYKITNLNEENERLLRTISGLKEAVRRWRRKAGQDQDLPEDFTLVKSEKKEFGSYYETWVIPSVDSDPALCRDAEAIVQNSSKKDESIRVVSTYFDSRNGWVAVFEMPW